VQSKALNVAIFFGALEVLLEKMQVTWQVRGAIIFYRQSKLIGAENENLWPRHI
jgi:hypothetical protein